MVCRRRLAANHPGRRSRRMVIYPYVPGFHPKPMEKKNMAVLHADLLYPTAFRALSGSGISAERRTAFPGTGSYFRRCHLSLADRIHATPFSHHRSFIRRCVVPSALLFRRFGCLGRPKSRSCPPSRLFPPTTDPAEHSDSFYYRRPEFTIVRRVRLVGHRMGSRSRRTGSLRASFRILSPSPNDPLHPLLSARHRSFVYQTVLSLAIPHHRSMHRLSALHRSLSLWRPDSLRHPTRKARPQLHPLRRLSPPLPSSGAGLSLSRLENLHCRTTLVICRGHSLCLLFDAGPHLKPLPNLTTKWP